MARPSVIPAVKERLEAYLENLEAVFQAQFEDQRTAPLPSTSDGKVNVRGGAQANIPRGEHAMSSLFQMAKQI